MTKTREIGSGIGRASHRHEELRARTTLRFDPAAIATMAPGSLVFSNVGNASTAPLEKTGALTILKTAPDLNGTPDLVVLTR